MRSTKSDYKTKAGFTVAREVYPIEDIDNALAARGPKIFTYFEPYNL